MCPTVYTYNRQKIFSFSVDHFVFTNSVVHDKMSHYAIFHLGLHYLIAKVRVKESHGW